MPNALGEEGSEELGSTAGSCRSRDTADWDPGASLPDAFLEVPHRVYRRSAHWIPEDAEQVRWLFGPGHEFFSRSSAWVGVLGEHSRLAGFSDPALRVQGRRVAYFGYFETEGGAAECAPLFERFEAWARAKGAEQLQGPVNFSTFLPYRLRTSPGLEAPCFLGEPYNPDHYPDILASFGYQPVERYITQDLSADLGRARALSRGGLDGTARQAGFALRALDGPTWMRHLPELHGVVDAIFGDNFGYTAISRADFERACGPGFARRLDPDASVIAHDSAGHIAGFFLVFPDYAPLVRQSAAPRLAARELAYARHASLLSAPTLLAKTLGVMPEHRSKQLGSWLSQQVVLRSCERYARGLGCLIKADNRSRRFLEGTGAGLRHYALYGKAA